MCVALRCRGSLEARAHATRESAQTKNVLTEEKEEEEEKEEKNQTLL